MKPVHVAILDKHTEWAVDVISMSFGFPNRPGKTCEIISKAFSKVKKHRNDSVLFLASAGNSWDRMQDFPASHKDVMPIHAATAQGEFLRLNPSHRGEGPEKLGTYGTDIPSSIVKEVQDYFPGIDLSAGTSIATALSAGIVGMMLSYIAALPSLLNFPSVDEICAILYTRRGMERILLAMSLSTGYR